MTPGIMREIKPGMHFSTPTPVSLTPKSLSPGATCLYLRWGWSLHGLLHSSFAPLPLFVQRSLGSKARPRSWLQMALRKKERTTGFVMVYKLHFFNLTFSPFFPSDTNWPHPAPDSPASFSLTWSLPKQWALRTMNFWSASNCFRNKALGLLTTETDFGSI